METNKLVKKQKLHFAW